MEYIPQKRFIGLDNCKVIPKSPLKICVLRDNDIGQLLFHDKKMVGACTTLKLRTALNMGYQITQIYAATSYTCVTSLMKDYVMHLLLVKICNNTPMDKQQCDALNRYHKLFGTKGWKDIFPEDTSIDPGLKQVAKLCLNILEGKTAQR